MPSRVFGTAAAFLGGLWMGYLHNAVLSGVIYVYVCARACVCGCVCAYVCACVIVGASVRGSVYHPAYIR